MQKRLPRLEPGTQWAWALSRFFFNLSLTWMSDLITVSQSFQQNSLPSILKHPLNPLQRRKKRKTRIPR